MFQHVFKAFGQGLLTLLRSWRVLGLLWLLNLLAALVIVVPTFFLLQRLLGHRLDSKALFDRFDLGWLISLLQRSPDTLLLMGTLTAAVAILYVLFSTFLYAGIIGVFHHRETPASLRHFFRCAGHYFFRFFRAFLLSLLFYGLFLFLYKISIAKWLDSYVKGSLLEPQIAWAAWCKSGGYVLIFLSINMLFDYVKIRLVSEQTGKVIRSTWRSLKFLLAHCGKVTFLYLLLASIGLAMFWGFRKTQSALPTQGMIALAYLFVLQQLYIVSRVWIRMHFFGSQMSLFQNITSVQQHPKVDDSPSLGMSELAYK